MHERYIAPAVALCILVGMLDRRLRPLMWGVSTTYGLNLSMIILQYWHPWDMAAPGDTLLQSIHVSICVVRFFCSLLNVAIFIWLVRQLPRLLSPLAPDILPGDLSFAAPDAPKGARPGRN
jgi:hypothetical protein